MGSVTPETRSVSTAETEWARFVASTQRFAERLPSVIGSLEEVVWWNRADRRRAASLATVMSPPTPPSAMTTGITRPRPRPAELADSVAWQRVPTIRMKCSDGPATLSESQTFCTPMARSSSASKAERSRPAGLLLGGVRDGPGDAGGKPIARCASTPRRVGGNRLQRNGSVRVGDRVLVIDREPREVSSFARMRVRGRAAMVGARRRTRGDARKPSRRDDRTHLAAVTAIRGVSVDRACRPSHASVNPQLTCRRDLNEHSTNACSPWVRRAGRRLSAARRDETTWEWFCYVDGDTCYPLMGPPG